jgi:hypothetical protein
VSLRSPVRWCVHMPAPPAPPEPLHTSLPSCCQTHCVMTAAAAGPHIRQHMKDAVGRPQSHNSDDPSLEPSSPRSPGRVGGGGGQVFAVLCLSLCCTRIPHILKYQWPVSYHSQMKVQHGAAGIQVPHPTPIIMLSATHLSAHTSSTGVRVSLEGSHTTTLPLAVPEHINTPRQPQRNMPLSMYVLHPTRLHPPPPYMSAPTSSTGVRVSLDGSHTTTLPLA